MITWFKKWMAFFSPIDGWKDRLLSFLAGKTAWDVPGKPECNQVIPWPVQWIPHVLHTGEVADDEARKRGFEFIPVVCTDSKKEAPPGLGVCCARCGVHLHQSAAAQRGNFTPPSCKRCRLIVSYTR